jgi:peroxiredoxin
MQIRRWNSLLMAVLVSTALLFFNAGDVMALKVGDKAPDFTLPGTTGEKISLSQFRGKKPVVLFFYIFAFGGAWTNHARSFEQDYSKFEATNAQVLGVSVDLGRANNAFAGTNSFSFPLLSDTERVTAKAYGVLYDDSTDSVLYRRAKRSWFVIDKAGIIRYAKTTGPGEIDKNDEVLQVLSELK